RAKGDWRVLGPKWGARAKEIIEKIPRLSSDQVESLRRGEKVKIDDVTINSDEVSIEEIPLEGLVLRKGGGITVALETTINEDLRQEGMARELVHHIQNLRKDLQLSITQRIEISYKIDEEWEKVLNRWGSYIASETLSRNLKSDPNLQPQHSLRIGDKLIHIAIKPIEESQ
ncbi:MAG: DUF5915 domain-containing protein, partial [bacterium]